MLYYVILYHNMIYYDKCYACIYVYIHILCYLIIGYVRTVSDLFAPDGAPSAEPVTQSRLVDVISRKVGLEDLVGKLLVGGLGVNLYS